METDTGILGEVLTPEVIAGGTAVLLTIAGGIWAAVRKRLRKKAAETETPIDDMIVNAIDGFAQTRKK